MKSVLDPKDNRLFQIDCSAEPTGAFRAGADRLSVRIGQRICSLGGEEIWDSVVVHCEKGQDELTVRILVCNPDRDEPIEIASIRSARNTVRPGPHIEWHLEHVIS